VPNAEVLALLGEKAPPGFPCAGNLFPFSGHAYGPPGNINKRSRLLLTNKIRQRFAAMSFDDFAITAQ
jgi:hypothetical protein